jgi:hypothetical protein
VMPRKAILQFKRYAGMSPRGVIVMEWSAPEHEVIELNCEVSSYANAEM